MLTSCVQYTDRDTYSQPCPSYDESYKDNWIRLARSTSASGFWRALHNASGCVEEALQTVTGKYSIADLCEEKALARECEWVFYFDDIYPKLLKTLTDPPPVLIARGNTGLLKKDKISIVGSRNCSVTGARFTRHIATELSQRGIVVVSGMAKGIDTAAHQAGLEGGTIAILASGIDVIYPEENTKLYHSIIEKGGLILAENKIGTPAFPGAFPIRNRLIAGISPALVVTECTMKSGSMNTARTACENNREVFAVPGHPFDPRSSGPNFLIRNGASLLTDIQEILQLYNLGCTTTDRTEQINTEGLLSALSHMPVDLATLASEMGVSTAEIRSKIMELELEGRAYITQDGRACLL